jgi:rhodanese-related sulfurtransferase
MAKKLKNNKNTSKKFNIWLLLGVLAIVIFAVLIGINTNNNTNTGLPLAVNVNDAYELRENGAFVLDVREQFEWDEVHIPGATLIPLGELESRLDEVPLDEEILVVCRSGNRSATARDILLSSGYTNVTSLSGGMNDWVINSYEVEQGP